MSDLEEGRGWKRIARALFHSRRPEPSEAFVAKVMAAIEAEESRHPAAKTWREILDSWRYPAVGLAFAAALAAFLLPGPQEEALSADTLLLADSRFSLADDWPAQPPQPDELLGLELEER